MQACLPSPVCSGLRVTAPFVVHKMLRSLLPPFPQLWASVRTGLCFSSSSNPNKELSRQADEKHLSAGGGAGGVLEGETGRRQSRWVGGRHSMNKGWEARRQSQGEGMVRGSV